MHFIYFFFLSFSIQCAYAPWFYAVAFFNSSQLHALKISQTKTDLHESILRGWHLNLGSMLRTAQGQILLTFNANILSYLIRILQFNQFFACEKRTSQLFMRNTCTDLLSVMLQQSNVFLVLSCFVLFWFLFWKNKFPIKNKSIEFGTNKIWWKILTLQTTKFAQLSLM